MGTGKVSLVAAVDPSSDLLLDTRGGSFGIEEVKDVFEGAKSNFEIRRSRCDPPEKDTNASEQASRQSTWESWPKRQN